jgi:hypothetical protein
MHQLDPSSRSASRDAWQIDERIRCNLRLAKCTAYFSFASSDFKVLGAFFCNIPTPVPGEPDVSWRDGDGQAPTLRLVSRSGARSAARARTTSCGFEATETIPFPGADSIFSSRCGAISGRLRFVVTPARAAIPATKTPRFQRSTIGSAASSERADGAPVSRPASSRSGQNLSGMGGRHDGREGKLRVAIFCFGAFLIYRKRYHIFCRSQYKNRNHLISFANLLLARHSTNTAPVAVAYLHMYAVTCIALPRAVSIGQVL